MELFFSNEMLMAYVEKITMQKITIEHSKNESGAFIQVQKDLLRKIMTFTRRKAENWHQEVPGARWFKADLHIHTIDDFPGGRAKLPAWHQ